jgi:hypothetical protein
MKRKRAHDEKLIRKHDLKDINNDSDHDDQTQTLEVRILYSEIMIG